jgi:hypothetical protein
MSKSTLEYLASLRKHGHIPEYIGHVTIGRTVYSAGRFVTPARAIDPGCRAYQEGKRFTEPETRIALRPIYRTDWVRHDTAGPTPALLPASAKRHAVYVDPHGIEWFIAGWHERDGVLWLNQVGDFDIDYGRQRSDKPYPRMAIDIQWIESFDTAMSLASSEIRARINA